MLMRYHNLSNISFHYIFIAKLYSPRVRWIMRSPAAQKKTVKARWLVSLFFNSKIIYINTIIHLRVR